jgi:hypothetical protein
MGGGEIALPHGPGFEARARGTFVHQPLESSTSDLRHRSASRVD